MNEGIEIVGRGGADEAHQFGGKELLKLFV